MVLRPAYFYHEDREGGTKLYEERTGKKLFKQKILSFCLPVFFAAFVSPSSPSC